MLQPQSLAQPKACHRRVRVAARPRPPRRPGSRLLGPLTGTLSWLLRQASARPYAATKGPRDEDRTGTHRHLTHTLLFAAALGAATAVGTEAGGPWAVAAVTVLAVLLAENALGDWLLPVSGGAIVWWAASSPNELAELSQLAGWLGIAVTTGCVAHCLGDAVTESGCPFLFPLPIAGETWYEIRPPKTLRFRTGKTVENALVFPAFTVLAVLLLPGVPELVAPALTRTCQRQRTTVHDRENHPAPGRRAEEPLVSHPAATP